MKLLCAYYKLDRRGDRLGRERCHEHVTSYDPITGKVKPLCDAAMNTELYVWKVIDSQPKYLCHACKQLTDQPSADREALRAWVSGEPIR